MNCWSGRKSFLGFGRHKSFFKGRKFSQAKSNRIFFMNILALMTDAYGSNGGIAQHNRDFLKALSLDNTIEEVTLLTRVSLFLPDRMNIPAKIKWVRKGINSSFGFILQLAKVIVNPCSYQIILCGHLHLLPFAWIVKMLRWNNPKLVLMIYGIEAWEPKAVRKFFLKKIDRVISISRLTRDKFLKWAHGIQNRVAVLPCSVELARFKPLANSGNSLCGKLGLSDKKVIMTVGRLDSYQRKKGFDEVLEVLPDLLKDTPNLIYLIVGDGPDHKRLREKVRRLRLERHVVFAGAISEEDKLKYYSLADVFVMPSSCEGFGIVILEALACGVPVIGSKVDGTREALLNGALGQLVDPRNSGEIKEAITGAILNGKAGVNKVLLETFSFENFQDQVKKIICEIVSR